MGKNIKALDINSGKVGKKTTLSIRPERIQIGSALYNKADAIVEELIYHGDHVRCRLNVEKNNEFIVKIPNSFKSIKLKKGQKTKVSWKIEDCRALDA